MKVIQQHGNTVIMTRKQYKLVQFQPHKIYTCVQQKLGEKRKI